MQNAGTNRPATVQSAVIGLAVGVACVIVAGLWMILGVLLTPQEGMAILIVPLWIVAGLVFAGLGAGLAAAVRLAARGRRGARIAATVLGVLTAVLVLTVWTFSMFGWMQWVGVVVTAILLISVVLLWVGSGTSVFFAGDRTR